jgi:DNA-binding LytR/AlgR family response regulator
MRIAIVEDEAPIARRLERSVRSILGERIAHVELLPDLPAALACVRTQSLDLVFLDLNLEGRDGFHLLQEAAASRFATIVVSAYEDQAMRAFEVGVTDFVPKPWTEARLRLAIGRATGQAAPGAARASRLAVRKSGGIELIELDQLVAIRAADDYAELHLAMGETRLHEKTLTGLESLLPEPFARVHRSWIVNLERVTGWAPAPGGRATLDVGGIRVPVGRSFRRDAIQRLEGHLVKGRNEMDAGETHADPDEL